MPPLESFPPGWTLLACDHGYTDIDMAKDSNSVGFVYKHTEYKTKTSGCGNRRACSHVCSATNEFLILGSCCMLVCQDQTLMRAHSCWNSQHCSSLLLLNFVEVVWCWNDEERALDLDQTETLPSHDARMNT